MSCRGIVTIFRRCGGRKCFQDAASIASRFSEDRSVHADCAAVFKVKSRQPPLNKAPTSPIRHLMAYNKCLHSSLLWRPLMPMGNTVEQKKQGRPALPPELKRTGRISMRTYPDVEEKARRVGTEAVENAIRAIKEPK